MTILLTVLSLLKSLFDLLKGFRGKSKRDAIVEANERVSEAREGQAHSDTEAAILKAKVQKGDEEKKSLEDIKNETEY